MIDLRSDTVTQPTEGMRAAMASARVGDDVFGEDPAVNQLEERVASMLGKEAALFVPSGTMSNQIGIRCHTQPGDELFCDVNNHIIHYETGAPAALNGVMCRTFEGQQGIIDVHHMEGQVKGDADYLPRTRLVCLENTHNRGGGKIYPLETLQRVARWAHQHGLAVHLDGARLWNASIATGIPLATWCSSVDSVSVCFSKGLGAPVGSALVGPKDFIKRARRTRKMFGGGMRQAGVLAAAANYALDHHIDRMADDHIHARRLAELATAIQGISLGQDSVETNLIFLKLDEKLGTAEELQHRLQAHGVLALPTARHTLRMVTHLDVSREQIEHTGQVMRQLLSNRSE